jgi:hypothetical protein
VAPLGASFVWLNADTVGDPAYADDLAAFVASGLDFVLEIKFTTEARLTNADGVWVRDCRNVRGLLRAQGLLGRCLAVQLDDEFYARFATSAGTWSRAQWPSVPRAARLRWHDLLPTIGAHVERRIVDLRQAWGRDLPAAGIGMAEPGGIIPPRTDGLDWWGVNGYLGPTWPRPTDVHRLYRDVLRFTPLPIMPVLGVYEDTTSPPVPPLATLAATYLPVLETHADRIWSVGIFCLHHPSQWAPGAHVAGRGLLELPADYRRGVRWLADTYGTPPTAAAGHD